MYWCKILINILINSRQEFDVWVHIYLEFELGNLNCVISVEQQIFASGTKNMLHSVWTKKFRNANYCSGLKQC